MKRFKAPTKSQRSRMPDRCFLQKKGKKYPVCDPRAKKPSCEGALAARRRAILNHDNPIASAALRLAKKLGCSWTKGK